MPKRPPPPRPYRAFGARLHALRQEARLTQEELAKAATSRAYPITHSAPSQWEKGEVRPTLPRLEALIRVLTMYGARVDRDELLRLAEYPGYQPLPEDMIPVDDPAKLADGRHLLRLPAVALAWLRNFADFLHLEAVDPAGEGLPGAAPPFGAGFAAVAGSGRGADAAAAGAHLHDPVPEVDEAGGNLMRQQPSRKEDAVADQHGI